MKKSENYEMNLPEASDAFDVEHMNANTKKIDELLKENNDKMQRVLGDIDISCSAIGKLVTITDGSDAPIISQTVKGFTEQKSTTGKNVCSNNDFTITADTGTAQSNYIYKKIDISDKLASNKTYIFSADVKILTGSPAEITVALFNENMTTGAGNVGAITDNHVEISIPVEDASIFCYLLVYAGKQGSTAGNSIEFSNVMLRESTTDSTYEPYTGGIASPNPDYPQEIDALDNVSVKTCGKNLLEITANDTTAYGITLTVNEDKSITLNGTATQDFITKIGEFNNSDDSYFMSGCHSGGSTSSYYLVASCRDENNTWKADNLDVGSGKALSNGYAKRLIQIGIKSGKTVSNLTFYPMIRNADITDATYEPYKETVAEFDLSDPLYEGDYIEYRADGTGVLYRKMAKVVFDGSSDENWNMLGEDTSRRFAMTAFANYKDKKNTVRSSHFVKSNVYSWAGMPDCSCLNADNALGFKYLSLTTLAEYKAWLQSNPVTVVYELATPQEIELTAEQLAQLKVLRTFEPITNIFSDSETTIRYYKNNGNGGAVGGLQDRVTKIEGAYADKAIYGDDAISLGRKADTEVGKGSVAIGYNVTASRNYSHAEGNSTTASGNNSHAEGQGTKALGDNSHAEGRGTQALQNQHAQGHYNDTSLATMNSDSGTSNGTAFVIGNGGVGSLSNAFRITGKGAVYAKEAYNATGADYAEFSEWADGNPNNEDRRGYFVTFDDEKPNMIRKANAGEYILGIVSGNPCIIGNADEGWLGRYVFDDFGGIIYEDKEVEETYIDEETGEEKTRLVQITTYKENPDYDPTQKYIHREQRQEWAAVGWIGVLSVRDDNTCIPSEYCKVTDGGIATACERGVDTFRVIERVKDNIVKVVLK